MNLLISDNWLRDYLKTKATASQIQKYLSLCGPSIEAVTKSAGDSVYSVEVTTNRVDTIGIYGIAREASAILPRFGIKASLLPVKALKYPVSSSVDYLQVTVDDKLCSRFTAVLIKNVHLKGSPLRMRERLTAVGVRPINNIVDISNYIMHELGQPVHTFDYDKIAGAKMILRASQKGEVLTTLDGKKHLLPGGDIVIEDGEGRLIDLAGIMGGENSAVDASTKNVLLFVQTYNPVSIRRTSMALAQRTEAAEIFEKGLDPELVGPAMQRGVELFVKLTGGKAEAKILDLYPNPYKTQFVSCPRAFIEARLGIKLTREEITKTLSPLGFDCVWSGDTLKTGIPSFRARDVSIPEDIVEEVARIYGYHHLPSELMTGAIPDPVVGSPFAFEAKVKNLLKGYGAVETYTLSLVPGEAVENGALRLRNPLGKESEYLRTSLRPSLLAAAKDNAGEKEPFHLFEMANVYIPRRGDLPQETMTLAGIFSNYAYREAKGVVEALLGELNVKAAWPAIDSRHFLPSQRLEISASGRKIGTFGTLSQWFIYYEFELGSLKASVKDFAGFKPLPKYPAQIEDMTFTLPARTKIGEVIDYITRSSQHVTSVELKDIYKDAYTFRIWYQHPDKTLSDAEVENIREKIIFSVKRKFGGVVK